MTETAGKIFKDQKKQVRELKEQEQKKEKGINYIHNVLKPLSKEEQKELEAAKSNEDFLENMKVAYFGKKEGGFHEDLYSLFTEVSVLDLLLNEEDYQAFVDTMPKKYSEISKNYLNQKNNIKKVCNLFQPAQTGISGKTGHLNDYSIIKEMVSIQRAALEIYTKRFLAEKNVKPQSAAEYLRANPSWRAASLHQPKFRR